jgi:hypothetical protein
MESNTDEPSSGETDQGAEAQVMERNLLQAMGYVNQKLDEEIKVGGKDPEVQGLLLKFQELFNEDRVKEIIRTRHLDVILDFFDKAMDVIADPMLQKAFEGADEKERKAISIQIGMLKYMRSMFKKHGASLFMKQAANRLELICPHCTSGVIFQANNKKHLQIHIKVKHKDVGKSSETTPADNLLNSFHNLSEDEIQKFLNMN